MQKKKLLLVGNHGATTAVAIIEEIKSQKLDWELYWVGTKYATEDKKSNTLEYQILPELGVNFISINSGKIQTKFTKYTIPALLRIPIGLFQALLALKKVNPDLVMSFGGASGALIAFWSWLFGIPVLIHEQTASAGRANIKSARFARKILISKNSSSKYFSEGKTDLVGNPILKSVLKYYGKNPRTKLSTILVTGGSRGSARINAVVKRLLPHLTQKYNLIHQTGDEQFKEFESIKIPNYTVVGKADPDKFASFYDRADLVIGRAGANTVSTLIALKKPAILIPIPWSFLDEQNENAKYMVDLGLAKVLPQSELSPDSLLKEINIMEKNYVNLTSSVKTDMSDDINASLKIVNHIKTYIG